jgi:hypothetical protein
MEKIIISNHVDNILLELVDILYEDEYFGFKVDAKAYVDKIYEFIYDIPNLPFKKTKENRFGGFYSSYKHCRNTTWYATFDYENETYLIKNIANNHSKEYAEFIGNIQ